MKTVACPECGRKVRPCNLERHRDTHDPVPLMRDGYVKFLQPKAPILQHRTKQHRYDEVVPRSNGLTRFRIYRLRAGELQLIGAAPTPAKFGQALFDFYHEGEFITDDSVGVLDTLPEPTGDWISHPFALGRRRT
jgi:hypothetical protein